MKLFLTLIFICAALAASIAAPSPVTITVDTQSRGSTVPDDFAGLSFETWVEAPDRGGVSGRLFSPTNTQVIALFTNCGIRNLRLGGGTVDGLRARVPTREDIDSVFGFAQAANISVIYSFRLLNGHAADDAGAAKYIWTHYRRWLDCFAIGNEPNEPPYSETPVGAITNYAGYLAAWQAFITVVTDAVPGAKFAGPDAGGTAWAASFAADEKSSGTVAIVTQHEYAGGKPYIHGTTTPLPAGKAINQMLSRNWMTNEYPSFCGKTLVLVATNDLADRMTEADDYLHGVTNASNAFASALWALDYMHWWAAHGCAGVNFHNNEWLKTDTIYLDPVSREFQINPKGYAIRAFDLGSHGREKPVLIANINSLNLTAYAIGDGTNLFVTIINKEHGPEARYASAKILPNGMIPKCVNVMYMKAPHNNPGAMNGITLGDAPISNHAPWQGHWKSLRLAADHSCKVTVRAASAAIVKFSTQED